MQNNLTTSAMRSGAILGILFSLNFLISLTGIPLIRLLLFAGIIYLTYRFTIQYRDKNNGGFLSYGQSFTYIFFSFFFAALISAFVKLIYFQFINTEMLSQIYAETMSALETLNFPMMDEMEESLQGVLKPAPYAFYSIFSNMLGGVFGALILAAFTKKEKSIFDKDDNQTIEIN